jgi:hypothetical protein
MESALEEILAAAVVSPGDPGQDTAFAGYQAQWLCNAIPGLKLDYFSASYVQTDIKGITTDVQCALWNLPAQIIDNYWTVVDFDVMAPVVYKNPGRIIGNDDIMPMQAWRSHPFFLRHCRQFGIHAALMINLRLPGRELTHITLEYLADEDNKTFKVLDRMHLENLTIPFAVSWFFRFGAIDLPILKRMFELLKDLTSTELVFLRKYVTCPHLDLAEQARDLGISYVSYKQSLYQMRDELHLRIIPSDTVGSRPSLRQLESAYSFLRLLHDPTASPSLEV